MKRLDGWHRPHPASSARGFTFVELMIAIALGLFLIGGLLTLVQAMRRTTTNQSGLSQLQDNERMAMQLIADVVQSTGYYYQPTLNTAASAFPVGTFDAAIFTYPGQALIGTSAPDIITSRYLTQGGDNIINCTGNPSPVAASWVNQLSIQNNYLTCTLWVNNAAPVSVPLVPGITGMQVLYGVQTGNGAASNSADTYLDAATVAAGNYWNRVKSVQVTLTFQNPLAAQPSQPNTIDFKRTIAVMYKTGVTT